MTRIEAKIYAALAGDDDLFTLEEIAEFYAQAHRASYAVYSRIQWELLDAHIREKRGQKGLDYVRREALRQQ